MSLRFNMKNLIQIMKFEFCGCLCQCHAGASLLTHPGQQLVTVMHRTEGLGFPLVVTGVPHYKSWGLGSDPRHGIRGHQTAGYSFSITGWLISGHPGKLRQVNLAYLVTRKGLVPHGDRFSIIPPGSLDNVTEMRTETKRT